MKPFSLLFILSFFIAYGSTARTGKRARWHDPWTRDDVHINLSIPWANQFYFRMPGADMANAGFLGMTMGSDYVYKADRFLSLQMGSAYDYPVPVPVPLDRFPDSNGYRRVETMLTTFASLRHNHAWKRFDFGYGLLLSVHSWVQRDNYIDSSGLRARAVRSSYDNLGLGGSFAAYYRLGRRFYTGLIYQPQLLSFRDDARLKYEHFISLDLLFRFSLRPGPARPVPEVDGVPLVQ